MVKHLHRTTQLSVWIVLLLSAVLAKAQITGGVQVLGIGVPIGTTSTTVTQNFDALNDGITVSAAGLLGNVQGTYTNRTLIFASTGAPNLVGAIVPTAGAYSFGNSSDRALGSNANSLNSAVGLIPIRYGVLFQNSTGLPISSLQVTYTGEQWYNDGDGAAQSITAAYTRLDQGSFSTIGGLVTGVLALLNDLPIVSTFPFTGVPGLTFTSPVATGSLGELNGNLPANRTTLSSVITFTTPLAPNEYVLLRWTDPNDPEGALDIIDTDHSLAIDDLTVIANVVNQNPIANQGAITTPQTATVGVAFSTTTAGAFTDPESQTLSFSATGLPGGFSINQTTGVITGTASTTVGSPFSVVITATDPLGGAASVNLTLNVVNANQPPTVVGTGITDPQNGTVGVAFTSNVAPFFSDPNSNPLTFTATGLPAGLGISSAGLITGTPSVSGSFGVTVTANDGQGGTVSDNFTLNVAPATVPNQPPTVVGTGITDPQNGTVGVAFTSNVAPFFSDPDNNPLSFTATGLPAGLGISSAGLITGTPSVSGSFGVTVTANDGQGGTVSDNFTLNVAPANAPPVVTNGGITDPQNGTVGVAFTSNVAPFFSDPNGNPLTFTAVGLPAGLGISSAGLITGTPSQSGTFGVTVTANDGQGGTVSDNFTLNVAPPPAGNRPPTVIGAGITDPQNGTVGIAFTSNIAPFFSDPDNNPLTFTAIGLPAGLTINSAGVITGTPSVAGTFGVVITANDGMGGTVSDNFSLIIAPATVPNQPPTVVGTGITDPQSGTVGVSFVSNVAPAFSDPDGNPLSFTAVGLPAGLAISSAGLITGTPSVSGSFGVTVTANDGQGGTVSDNFTLNVSPVPPGNQPPFVVGNGITDPQNGTVGVAFTSNVAPAFTDPNGNSLTFTAIGLPPGLSISPAGLITGTPTSAGSFGVVVTANDGQGGTVSDGFTINVAPASVPNQPPVVVGNGITDPQSGTVGVAFVSDVAPAFSDPNGNPLTFTAVGLPAGLGISSSGLITGTPSVSGTFGVTITANDGQGGTVSDNFTLNVSPAPTVNQPPVVVGNGITDPQNGTVGVAFASNVAPAFSDPNGNPLTFTAIGLPAGLSINSAGLISGTPTISGSFGVVVTANDGQGGTVSDGFTLNVAPAPIINQPPTVVGNGITDPQSATVGVSFTSNVAPFFTDPNNNPLTFTAIGLPPGLSISPAGLITGAPSQSGAFGVTVTANDGQGGTVSDNFTLNVAPAPAVNQPPVVVGNGIIDPQSATVGVAFTSNVAPAFTDPNNNPLTFTAVGLPPGLSISPTGLITGTPSQSGTFGVTVTANDGQGGTVSDNFTLNVAPAQNPITTPFCGSPSNTTGIGQPLVITGVTDQNCLNGTFRVLTTGGTGQAIDFSVIIGLSNNDPFNCVRQVDNGEQLMAINSPNSTITPFEVNAMQSGVMTNTFYFDFKLFCTGQTTSPPSNTTTPPPSNTTTPTPSGCGSPSATLGQPLVITGVTDVNCQVGSFRILMTGGNGQPINFAGIVGLNSSDPYNCVRMLDNAEQLRAVNSPNSNISPFALWGMQVGGSTSNTFMFDFKFACTNTASNTTTTPPSSTTSSPTPGGCGSPANTLGQSLVVAGVTDVNCQTGSFRILTTGGNGQPINFAGIVGLNSADPYNCVRIVDNPDLVRAINNPNSDIRPFQLKGIQVSGNTSSTFSFNFKQYCTGVARVAKAEPESELEVTVLGNPTLGENVEVVIGNTANEPVTVQVNDAHGLPISQLTRESIGNTVRERVGLGRSAGLYLLRVTTPTRTKTVKVVRQ